MGFASIAPGGFSSLPGPARVPGALTSGREVAALGHHGCGTTDRQPRLPFPSSHPPPQPSSHLAGTSGIRSRVAKRLFLIGLWHHTLFFSLFKLPRACRWRDQTAESGFLWRTLGSPVFSVVADGGRSGLYYPVVVAAQRRHVMSTFDGQTPHTTFLTWDMHLGHGRRTTKYTFFHRGNGRMGMGYKTAFHSGKAREGIAQWPPTQLFYSFYFLYLVSNLFNSTFLPIFFTSGGRSLYFWTLFHLSSQLPVLPFPARFLSAACHLSRLDS